MPELEFREWVIIFAALKPYSRDRWVEREGKDFRPAGSPEVRMDLYDRAQKRTSSNRTTERWGVE